MQNTNSIALPPECIAKYQIASVNNVSLYFFTAQEEVLHFQLFRFKKETGPSFIPEGEQSVYTVLMDGPPDNEVTLELATAVDGYIR